MSATSNKRLPSSPAESGDSSKKRFVDAEQESDQILSEQESNSSYIEGDMNQTGDTEDPANREKQTSHKEVPRQIDSEKIDQILEVVSFLKNKTTDTDKIVQERCGALEKTQAELVNKVNDGLSQIQTNKIILDGNVDKVSLLLDRLTACEREKERLNEELTGAINKISNLESRADIKDREFVELSIEVKDRKLVISGVPEFAKEKIFVTAVSTINKLIKTANAERPPQEERSEKIGTIGRNDLINAYRIGKYKNGLKRNILIFCSTNEVKHRIITAKSLTKKSKGIKFYINDDQSQATRAHKSRLWRLSDAANKLGREAKVVGNKIIIDGQSYAQN